MIYRLPLRVALFSLLGIAAFTPFSFAQPAETPIPEPILQATPTPEPTVTPEPTIDPEAPYLVPPIDPDAEPTPEPEPTPSGNAPEAAPSINVKIGIKGANTASNLIPIKNRKTCLIRLATALTDGSTSATVWLTSPDDRVHFVNPSNAQNQLKVVLPGNLDTVSFDVVGAIGSKAPNDATVNAHRNYANTAICGTVKLTVWWTSYAKMDVLQGEGYIIKTPMDNATYGPSPNNVAVKLRGQYTLNPVGANFSGFGIGIMQNFRSSGYSILLSPPSITYGTAVKGDQFTVNTTIRNTSSVPNVANDCRPSAWPLYTYANPAAGGTNAIYDIDSPSILSDHPNVKIYVASGQVLATIKWETLASINADARDWVVTYIKSTGEIYPSAESNWALDVSTANTGVQKVRNGSSHAVQTRGVTGTASTTANKILEKNQYYFNSGTTPGGTTTFTR